MIAQLHPQAPSLRPALHRLIARHGATAVTFALFRALLVKRRKRPRPPDLYHLSAHLRRDIGLEATRPYVPKYYDLR
ncbi:MAG: hypothetical protein L0G27_11010 [Paracoccus sp. (in: a-proteobacteria)]|nr:hypothetical protein [Paracoccus sp. (in: a-proteobacteria)]